MSLFSKIKSLLGRQTPAQPPVGPATDHGDETQVSAPPATGTTCGKDSGLKNSIARGAAEGTVRETLRKFFEELLDE